MIRLPQGYFYVRDLTIFHHCQFTSTLRATDLDPMTRPWKLICLGRFLLFRGLEEEEDMEFSEKTYSIIVCIFSLSLSSADV